MANDGDGGWAIVYFLGNLAIAFCLWWFLQRVLWLFGFDFAVDGETDKIIISNGVVGFMYIGLCTLVFGFMKYVFKVESDNTIRIKKRKQKHRGFGINGQMRQSKLDITKKRNSFTIGIMEKIKRQRRGIFGGGKKK